MLSALLHNLSHVVADSRVFQLEFLAVSPLVHLLVHEALSIFEGVRSIYAALQLIRVSDGAILKIQHPDATREALRRLHIVAEVDVRVCLLEGIDVGDCAVVTPQVLAPQEVVDGIASLILVVKVTRVANCDIHCYLRVIINLVPALLNS